MKEDELNFLGDDPGAVKYGNFINYYTFNNAQDRIKNLDSIAFPVPSPQEPYLCLDIGCNSGELTYTLYEYITSLYPQTDLHILAIDIDPNLINRAQTYTTRNKNLTFIAVNIMTETGQQTVQKYLGSFKKSYFNAVFCFSVTMWIHINNGDEGLFTFLDYIKNISKSIVIEPQPWNCYRNAQRRMKKSGSTFPLYELLKVRSNVDTIIEKYIIENNHVKIYESPKSSWNRKILSFKRL